MKKIGMHVFSMQMFFLIGGLGLVGLLYGGSFILAKQNLNSNRIEKRFAYVFNQDLNYTEGVVLGRTSEDVMVKAEARSVPVLYYHGISETSEGGGVAWEDFRDQMFTLKKNGYETISVKELDEFLTNGKSLPEKSFLLTFDDGRKDSYYPVDPILAELGYRAVMFVISSTLEETSDYYLSSDELSEMLKTGRWEIQSHGKDSHGEELIDDLGTMGHWLTNKLWLEEEGRLETDEEYEDRVVADLQASKEDLERRFGVEISGFAFPFGDYGQGTTNYDQAEEVLLRSVSLIYKFAFYQPWEEGWNRNYPGVDTAMVKRIGVEGGWNGEELFRKVARSEDKKSGVISLAASDEWTKVWGDFSNDEDGVIIGATPETTGGTAYLSGTEAWDNYELDLTIDLNDKAQSFSIFSRSDQDGNYSFCTFSKNAISYGEKNGEERVGGPSWRRNWSILGEGEARIGVRVLDNYTECLVNGVVAVRAVKRNLGNQKGMVGLSVWGPEMDGGAVVIKSLTVNEMD